MNFDSNTLLILQRIAVPGVCALIGSALIAWTDPGENVYEDEPVQGKGFQTFFGALLCGAGLVASDFWFRDIIAKPGEWQNWKASYQWQWMVWTIPAAMIVLAIARACFTTPIHYVAIAGTLIWSISIGILFFSLNEGDVWQEQSSMLMPWLAAGAVAMALNTYSLNAIAKSGGSRWHSLIVLAQFGCVAAIAIQAYGSLGEFAIAGSAVAAGASIISLAKGSTSTTHFGWQLSTIVLPLAIMAVSILAVSRFFEAVQLPNWLIPCVLFLPTLSAIVDLVFGRLSNAWIRPMFSAAFCSGILGWIVYLALSKTPDW
jgi:hypothetical protein